jgi:hypothetical protein
MPHKRTKALDEATLLRVVEEMAKPRLAASVRKGMEKTTMSSHAKFVKRELLHNPTTKEDGLVTKIYERGAKIMYEVAVPSTLNAWKGHCYVSDWAETNLELSHNVNPSHKPRRNWPSQSPSV